MPTPLRRKTTALLFSTATLMGLAFTAPAARAQDAYGYNDAAYSGPERVIVEAPRYPSMHGYLGGKIVEVSMSREVRIDDLDLRSAWGRRELRTRIDTTAAEICSNLTRMYPIGVTGSPPCYEQAVERAMRLAHAAIRDRYED